MNVSPADDPARMAVDGFARVPKTLKTRRQWWSSFVDGTGRFSIRFARVFFRAFARAPKTRPLHFETVPLARLADNGNNATRVPVRPLSRVGTGIKGGEAHGFLHV